MADDARLLPIAPLPPDFGGLLKASWSCRNFQFGVQMFGYRDPRRLLGRDLDGGNQ